MLCRERDRNLPPCGTADACAARTAGAWCDAASPSPARRTWPMALLPRFDPPAFMTDLDHVAGGRDAWDDFMGRCFEWAIGDQKARIPPIGDKPGTVQFFNPRTFDPTTTVIEQPIVWNAFPKTLLAKFGRDRAMIEADSLWPFYPFDGFDGGYDSAVPGAAAKIANTTAWTRPLDEYCEWRVERNPGTGQI